MTPRFAAVVLLGAAAFACRERAEPPPPTCAGKCGPVRPGGWGQPLPPDGTGGGGGAPGSDDTPVRLVGSVGTLDDIAAFQGTTFREPVDILVEGADMDVRARWTGLDSEYEVDGVKRGTVVWVQSTPGPSDALRTLQPLDTHLPDASGVVEKPLTVVRASALELAYGVLPTPIAIDENAAQAVLVVTKDEVPAEGVGASATGAQSVVYVENGGFTDDALVTDPTGVFVLANIPASPWPGGGVTVTLSGEVTGRWDLRVVSGGVTFAALGD